MYVVHLKDQLGAIFTNTIQTNEAYVHVEKAHWYTDYDVLNRHLIKEIEKADIPTNSIFMIETTMIETELPA